jgi:RES domain-containing protein
MFVYRISKSEYIKDLSGFGAAQVNNRWNSKGVYMLYASSARSLAFLEILVHVPINLLQGFDLSIITLKVDPNQMINHKPLSKHWNTNRSESMNLGDEWIISRVSVGMQVPSVVIPEEYNVILNPKHSLFKKAVEIIDVSEFKADKRLFLSF